MITARPRFDETIIRVGPNTEYEILRIVTPTDTLQVLGRYEADRWWYVELPDQFRTRGWVADLAVDVAGFAEYVPLVAAPPLNGVVPNPQTRWAPTRVPEVDCNCRLQPVAQAVGDPSNVRSGPGLDYDIIETLPFFSRRPIVGRYQYGDWWLIQLDDQGSLGWVGNTTVDEWGLTGLAPIVGPDAVSGVQPTPGIPWNPTPIPGCDATATPNPTNTPQPASTATKDTSTESATSNTSDDSSAEDTSAPATEEAPAAESTPAPVTEEEPNEVDQESATQEPATEVAAVEPTEDTSSTGSTSTDEETASGSSETDSDSSGTDTATNEPSASDGNRGRSNVLLIGGIGLVLAAVGAFFLLGRDDNDEEEDPQTT